MSVAILSSLSARQELYERFKDRFEIAHHLNRQIVSFQANKTEPITRWFKYKEGFSTSLVRHFLQRYSVKPGRLLDPFAGVGTSLFVGRELGWESHGIELLPVGALSVRARELLTTIDKEKLKRGIREVREKLGGLEAFETHFQHIKITRGAFPKDTELFLNGYLEYCSSLADAEISTILYFIGFTILEEISFTRKDGQYLRWDHRSERVLSGKPFDKGRIYSFKEAIVRKLDQIEEDFFSPSSVAYVSEHRNFSNNPQLVRLTNGSCLDQLPEYENDYFDFVITSPPYCNRYDYTRTYALELAYLGCNESEVRRLRQEMLSCTVENKEKIALLDLLYSRANRSDEFSKVCRVYNESEAMAEVNNILSQLSSNNLLNNKNIVRMVRNYFVEMCFVVYELARVIRSGGYCVIVNDNVRYGGEEVPVDLILAEFAEAFGFNIERIFVLPRGKGNSSQQMGAFGRTETRKCVYLWQKS